MNYQRKLRDYRRRAWRNQRSSEVTREEEAEKERMRRDARVTATYGESAHRSCGRKRRYGTEADALAAATRRVLKGAPLLRAYRCKYCDGWHLTKSKE